MKSSIEQKIAEALASGATSLDLRGNQLTTLPESLSALVNLETLDLSGNQLTTRQKSLKVLKARGCRVYN